MTRRMDAGWFARPPDDGPMACDRTRRRDYKECGWRRDGPRYLRRDVEGGPDAEEFDGEGTRRCCRRREAVVAEAASVRMSRDGRKERATCW
jgi:hypothetical protein